MTLFYSPSTRGFYDDAVHAAAHIPADAQAVEPARHAELLDAQASEAPVSIVPRETGTPVMSRQRSLTDAERRARLHAILDGETARRIAGVADIQQQLLDMRLGGAEADARFAGIDAIRATAATIGTAIDAAPGGDLTAFDPTDAAHWEAP
ncbi:MAG: hypothetical protein CL808_02680 [Citromicrobium sp.]|mgnify:CR=1 FL=1|nr:hypothetical protein [Citromicrobium sp.]